MNILLLGGIAESRCLAALLLDGGHELVYSVAGRVRAPQLDCTVHTGGFSRYGDDGVDGLRQFLQSHDVDLLIDCTHPYAAQISAHAVDAANRAGRPCWRYQRPGWDRVRIPSLHVFTGFDELAGLIEPFSRPFFSIGASALDHLHLRAAHQRWLVRGARPFPDRDGVTQVNAIGPFSLDDELRLMREHGVDALVSKDSGCSHVAAKVDAAAHIKIPVFLWERPVLVPAHREFADIHALAAAVNSS